MRSIGNVQSEKEALRFSAYLKRCGIAHTCDADFEKPSDFVSYQFWVHDEDRLEEARRAFETFLAHPADPLFDIPITEEIPQEETPPEDPEPEAAPARPVLSFFTKGIILLCLFFYFFSDYQVLPLAEKGAPEKLFPYTPLQIACLYDVPPSFEELKLLLQNDKTSSPSAPLSPEVQAKAAELFSKPYWRGFYDWTLLKFKTGDASQAEGPMFIKIRQGELWRFFSPCVLHGGFLHILFNMIWVWVLCRPIEQRIGFFRTLLLSAVIAIGSNTAQYLMGGPFFIGYSGVVMGLAGFIWSREKLTPWEGYPIQRSSLLFLLLFVLAIFALQFISFILQMFSSVEFVLPIANTAHISGGLIGLWLGRFSFFSWRLRR